MIRNLKHYFAKCSIVYISIYSFFLFLFCLPSQSQTDIDGGAAYQFTHGACLSTAEKQHLAERISDNISTLKKQQNNFYKNAGGDILYELPLQQAEGFDDCGFYAISNYFDHDPSNQVLDYNCGNDTYNTHDGTDFFLWPFDWTQMDSNAVEVIAAAPGIIVDKIDGNFDENCEWQSDATWNYIAIMHADGSITKYGHLKAGSLTSKNIGDSVVTGEYLGIVGSSGRSTAPHLHFEVEDSTGMVIDPFAGPCNDDITESCWADGQLDYQPSGINKVSTHSGVPDFNFNTCPERAETMFQDDFCPGDPVYFMNYLRHFYDGSTVENYVYRPDGSLFNQWFRTYNAGLGDPYQYSSYYWWRSLNLPFNAEPGEWTYEVRYEGEVCTHKFYVGDVDLRVEQSIDMSQVSYGDTISYCIDVINEGSCPADNPRLAFVSDGTYILNNTLSTTQGYFQDGFWYINDVAGNDTVSLKFDALALREGVSFSTSEIIYMFGDDVDSTPNNGISTEDDIATSCFSTPLFVCENQDFSILLEAPTGYDTYTWYYNNQIVQSSSDPTYTVSELGTYTYTVNGGAVGSCMGGLCCPLVIESEYCPPCPSNNCMGVTVSKNKLN